MDRSTRSHSPTRSNVGAPIGKPAPAQRNISTASGMAATAGTTGNALLDHSLRIDSTRRTDNTRNRAKDLFGNATTNATTTTTNNNNNKESSSPPTPTTKHDNRNNNTITVNNNNDILQGNSNSNNNNNSSNGRRSSRTNINNNGNTGNNGGLRRRAYSWRGERPPSQHGESKENDEAKNDIIHVVSSELLPMMNREARSVTAWVTMATLIQLVLSLVVQLASHHHHHHNPSLMNTKQYYYWVQRALVIPSLLAGAVLEVLPQKVFSNQAPGFIYASAWLLIVVQEKLGSLPHIPSRICAGVLGRLSLMECAVAVTVQFTCTISTTWLLQYCLFSNKIANLALKPIEYSSSATGEDGNPWIVDFFHELIVNTLFTIALQVLPVLLRLNRASRWWTLLFVYPMYMYSVDSSGQGSTLSPGILFALSYSRKDACQLVRCVAQLLSGLAAGKIMQVYFPDDPKEA